MNKPVPPGAIAAAIIVVLLLVGVWFYAGSQVHGGSRPSGPESAGGRKVLPTATGGPQQGR